MGEKIPRMTPALFHVLLSMAEEAKHGYALIGEVSARTAGRVELGPSSLYYSLGRLEDTGLISQCLGPEEGDEPHEEQRRYYGLTAEGRQRLAEELSVLSDIVTHAREIGFNAGRTG